MVMSKTALVLYPHQLYPIIDLPKVDRVYMVEDRLFFGADDQFPLRFHAQKLVLQRASMRRYVEEVLWPAEYDVEYLDFDPLRGSGDVFVMAEHDDVSTIKLFDPMDDELLRRVHSTIDKLEKHVDLRVMPSPNFYLQYSELKDFFHREDDSEKSFAAFYQWQRERFNILIGANYRPVGGKWMFDNEKQQRLAPDQVLPGLSTFGDNKFVEEAKKYVAQKFPQALGSAENFLWPTNHEEAGQWLTEFVEKRLDQFAVYEQAIDAKAPFLYHSLLSIMLNIGLLHPKDAIEAALHRHEKHPVPLDSLEHFIREILGIREYVRGIYVAHGENLRTKNYFKQANLLTESWYEGATGILPLDDVLMKVNEYGYAHQTERQQIIGNLMLLCEIHPVQVYQWFMEHMIDAFDWVVTPSVFAFSQFADGGAIAPEIKLFTSEDILSVSNYERGDWCDIWDGLYWRFIEKNAPGLKHDPAMKQALSALRHVNPNRRRIIGYRAEDFLKEHTSHM
jgi:deoxyribodipyrimidine photolyase-related protein